MLAFGDGFPMFGALVGAVSLVCAGSEHVSEHLLAPT